MLSWGTQSTLGGPARESDAWTGGSLGAWRRWTMALILGSLGACAGLSSIHARQRLLIERAADLVGAFRQARVQLAKGLVQATHARADSAEEDLGNSRIAQAVSEMVRIEIAEDLDQVRDPEEDAAILDFQNAALALQRAPSPATGAHSEGSREAQIRLLYRQLDRRADRLDQLHYKDLEQMRLRLDRQFFNLVSAAAILLAAICVGVVLAGRGQNRVVVRLAASEDRLSSVIAHLVEGLVVVDGSGHVIASNETAHTLLGFADAAGLARAVERGWAAFAAKPLEHAAAGEGVRRGAWEPTPVVLVLRGEILRDYREELWEEGLDEPRVLSFNGSRVRDASGTDLAFLTFTDITPRIRAEEALSRDKADLERRVAERTAQLEASNGELESFAYSVSHDLRAPLRAIDGFGAALREDYGDFLPGRASGYLDVIRAEAQRMGILIDHLLAFSRLNRATLDVTPVGVGALVEAAWEGLRAEREGRSVEIRIDPLPDCRGDGVLLGQVWSNLLSNALKYTRRKPLAVIEVSGWSEAGIPSYSVRDNGAGFDMRYVHTLFGVFRRLHRAEEFEGTGVGLALAKRIVQRHGGTIWGEGEVGKGARFTFTVPGLPAGGPAPGEKQA